MINKFVIFNQELFRYVYFQEDGYESVIQQGMYWYTKDLDDRNRPVYSHYIDGTPARGSLQNLYAAARTMAFRGVMRDRGYVFPMNNVAVDYNYGVVTGQSVHHIGKPWFVTSKSSLQLL